VNLDAIVWLDSKALMYVLFIQEVTCYDMWSLQVDNRNDTLNSLKRYTNLLGRLDLSYFDSIYLSNQCHN
jgi:hypothetical protein